MVACRMAAVWCNLHQESELWRVSGDSPRSPAEAWQALGTGLCLHGARVSQTTVGRAAFSIILL
jgi:hypothetical protein